ncbi:MAG: hypothetical protein ACOY3P_03725, partial [Planctomycetota bacterium]
MDLVCYIPSYENSLLVCESVASARGLPCVVVDNGSLPEHMKRLEALAESSCGQVTLIHHARDLGRLANWEFCLEHFRQSDRIWLKWLFAGDLLLPGAAEALQAAERAFPEARMIAAGFLHIQAERRMLLRPAEHLKLYSPADSLVRTAREGNWFGPPSAWCLHREAVVEGCRFGSLPWSADLALAAEVAVRWPVAAQPRPVVEFHADRRMHYRCYVGTVGSLLQEGLVREESLRSWAPHILTPSLAKRTRNDCEGTVAVQVLVAALRQVGLLGLVVAGIRLAARRVWRATIARRLAGRLPVRSTTNRR